MNGGCSLFRVTEHIEVVVSAHTIQIYFRATGGHLRRFKLNVFKSRAACLTASVYRCFYSPRRLNEYTSSRWSRCYFVYVCVCVCTSRFHLFSHFIVGDMLLVLLNYLRSANLPMLQTQSRDYMRHRHACTDLRKCKRAMS